METDITFCVQLSPEGHPAAIECIYGLSYEWSLECGAMRYIFGLFIGCWIEHSAYVPEKDSDHLRRLTAEDIIKSGFGQFVLVEAREGNVSVFSSKSCFLLHWCKVDGNRFLFSSNIGVFSENIDSNIKINEYAIKLETEFFYRSPFDPIVENLQSLTLGQHLLLTGTGQVKSEYFGHSLFRNDWTIAGDPEKLPYLDGWIEVICRSEKKVVLYLSGGLDSTVLLLKMKEAGIPVIPIVVTQKYRSRYSAHNEIAHSYRIAKLIGVERNLLVADLEDSMLFNHGKESGWKWGFAYYALAPKTRDHDVLFVTGNGDSVVGIEHTAFRLFGVDRSILNPFAFFRRKFKELVERSLYSDYVLTHLLNVTQKSGALRAGAPYVPVVFGGPYMPSPLARIGKETFRYFANDYRELIEYRRRSTFDRLWVDSISTSRDAVAWFRLIRYYLYIGASSYQYPQFFSHPFVETLPWFATRIVTSTEIFSPKHYQHLFFKKAIGRSYKHVVRLGRKETRALAKEQISQATGCEDVSTDLSASTYYRTVQFMQFIQELFSGGSLVLDYLTDPAARSFYEVIVKEIRSGTFSYRDRHQPKHLVNLLRFELFLRRLCGATRN